MLSSQIMQRSHENHTLREQRGDSKLTNESMTIYTQLINNWGEKSRFTHAACRAALALK